MRIIFGIGVGQTGKRYGLERITLEHRDNMLDAAIDHVAKRFGGCFVQHGVGAWIQDGKLIRESGIAIIVDNVPDGIAESELRTVANTLRNMFRQDSVIVTTIDADTFFVE